MIRRTPRSTRTDNSFPTRRSSDLLRPGRTDLGRLCASSTSAVEHKIVHRDAAGRRRSQSIASIAPPAPTLIGSPPILALSVSTLGSASKLCRRHAVELRENVRDMLLMWEAERGAQLGQRTKK